MKVSYNWLKEFVKISLSPSEIASRLTMAGLEVAQIEETGEEIKGVVVSEILSIQPHPVKNDLKICQVTTGNEVISVVCGAANVAIGLKSPLALPGAILPGGRHIETSMIHGVESRGMLCSEAELGISDDGSVIMALPVDSCSGVDVVDYLKLKDDILELEITPNRPDCLSIIGIAREIAVITGEKLKHPSLDIHESDNNVDDLTSVHIIDEDLCPRYTARLIQNVSVKPSPFWMTQRLRAVGLRPINNIVDVTNYVLWELGHPLHAFDFDLLLEKRIIVRRANESEEITTLDGTKRILNRDMLVIADAKRAIAMAGIMGGSNTEVNYSTKNVLLESAYFNPASIRRTSKKLGFVTEASYRFERMADIDGLVDAQNRAAQLVADLGDGILAKGIIDAYPHPFPEKMTKFRMKRYYSFMGMKPSRKKVSSILEGLGFNLASDKEGFIVRVPSFRRDIQEEADLFEEVARIDGYDKIPLTLPVSNISLTMKPAIIQLEDRIRDLLNACGLNEAINYSFTSPQFIERFYSNGIISPGDIVRLKNPLSVERSAMRPLLVFGLLETISFNICRQIADLKLFEIGKVFKSRGENNLPNEEKFLGIVITGNREELNWYHTKGLVDYYSIKGIVETLLDNLGYNCSFSSAMISHLELNKAENIMVNGERIGYMGQIGSQAKELFNIISDVFVAELNIDRLYSIKPAQKVYRPFGKFPAIIRDIAVVVPNHITSGEIIDVIRSIDSDLIRSIKLFDIYHGMQVKEGKKSLAYSIVYQADDRTLTDKEVNDIHCRIADLLKKNLNAKVRGVE